MLKVELELPSLAAVLVKGIAFPVPWNIGGNNRLLVDLLGFLLRHLNLLRFYGFLLRRLYLHLIHGFLLPIVVNSALEGFFAVAALCVSLSDERLRFPVALQIVGGFVCLHHYSSVLN
jgi:hypothetical protein